MSNFHLLQAEFGSNVLAHRDYFCFQNAIKAALTIAAKDPANPPQIYEVKTPKGTHAYLLYRGNVYNEGVTWMTDYYPDYSPEEIRRLGRNVTVELLKQATGKAEDVHNYSSFVDRKMGKEFVQIAQNLLTQRI